MTTFEVLGKPQPKERPRLGKGGHVYTPRATKAYEEQVAWAAIAAGVKLGDKTRIALTVDVYTDGGNPPDGSNVFKAVEDGLQRISSWNDRYVREGRFIVHEDEPPARVRITIEVLEQRET